jgi:hypothetical protein
VFVEIPLLIKSIEKLIFPKRMIIYLLLTKPLNLPIEETFCPAFGARLRNISGLPGEH